MVWKYRQPTNKTIAYQGLNNRVENAHQPTRGKKNALFVSNHQQELRTSWRSSVKPEISLLWPLGATPTQPLSREFNFKKPKKFGIPQRMRFSTPKICLPTFCRFNSLVDGGLLLIPDFNSIVEPIL
jgi:hypothetical protein